MLQGQSSADREMDLANNLVGRDIGRRSTSRDDIERLAREAMQDGRATTITQVAGMGY